MNEEVCQKCGSKNIVGVEYAPGTPERHDGVSEFDCRDCGVRIGRWSGKELSEGEAEKRWGGKSGTSHKD